MANDFLFDFDFDGIFLDLLCDCCIYLAPAAAALNPNDLWREAKAQTGRIYYYKKATRETTWNKPAIYIPIGGTGPIDSATGQPVSLTAAAPAAAPVPTVAATTPETAPVATTPATTSTPVATYEPAPAAVTPVAVTTPPTTTTTTTTASHPTNSTFSDLAFEGCFGRLIDWRKKILCFSVFPVSRSSPPSCGIASPDLVNAICVIVWKRRLWVSFFVGVLVCGMTNADPFSELSLLDYAFLKYSSCPSDH